eukprot:CAMPEP_0196827992 /NCGR_PEP_ID=MMETSP1362-20130617/94442_1 /TAXON_ID=163516 /ORGANISM="Leptocylindrus danicus, Strain CCMP1856" /LENGTH=273 /DNA_ID=CAMNT_0042208649 /DNA_START=388 /DNA_END=1209 /DNA_ORIENTATION=-
MRDFWREHYRNIQGQVRFSDEQVSPCTRVIRKSNKGDAFARSGKGQIVSEYFPPDDRSLPKITTLCRSDVNDKEIDPIWADAMLAEKKCLDSARKLHNEISAVIEEATLVYTSNENKSRLTPRMAPNKKIQDENESDESDWLAPYIRARGLDPQGEITHHEEIRLDCLQDLNERLDGREHIIRSRIEEETANISQLNARLRKYNDEERSHTEEPEPLEVKDVLRKKEEAEIQLKVLQKRLDAHENLVQSKREVRKLSLNPCSSLLQHLYLIYR